MTLVSDLSPYTNYTCSVFGQTKVGTGPPITGIGLTDEDSKCVYIVCVCMCMCVHGQNQTNPILFFSV